MTFDFTAPMIAAGTDTERQAAGILADELLARTGVRPAVAGEAAAPGVVFCEDKTMENRDAFALSLADGVLTVTAAGIRGMVYGIGLFLRRTVYRDGRITLLYDISGQYAPDKPIRGHQPG